MCEEGKLKIGVRDSGLEDPFENYPGQRYPSEIYKGCAVYTLSDGTQFKIQWGHFNFHDHRDDSPLGTRREVQLAPWSGEVDHERGHQGGSEDEPVKSAVQGKGLDVVLWLLIGAALNSAWTDTAKRHSSEIIFGCHGGRRTSNGC